MKGNRNSSEMTVLVLCLHLFIQSYNKHLLSTFYVPGTILNTLDIALNKTDKSLPDVFGFIGVLLVDLRGSNNIRHCKKTFCCLYVNDRACSFHQILKEDDDGK